MKYVSLVNGKIFDIVAVDPYLIFNPGYAKDFIEAPEDITKDWIWDGENFNPPVAVPVSKVPSAVTMRQARLALLSIGLLDDVETAINSLPSPQKEAARIEWEYSQEVQRHNGFVSVLAPSLGLNEESLDNLFIEAAKL